MKTILTSLVVLILAVPALAQDKQPPEKLPPEKLPPPKAKQEKAKEEPADDEPESLVPKPPAELVIVPGQASATPSRKGVSFANGGVTDVAQPNPTTIVVTMSGLTATNADLLCTSLAHYHFELEQCFEVRFNAKKLKGAKLTLEGRVVGLLRTDHEHHVGCCDFHKKYGTAGTDPATASISAGPAEIVTLTLPARQVGGGDDLSVYNREGPLCVPVTPGKYELHETWGFGTTHPAFCCHGASAEFSPQPYYCPETYWFQYFRPFNGTATKDFGYQVTIKLIAE